MILLNSLNLWLEKKGGQTLGWIVLLSFVILSALFMVRFMVGSQDRFQAQINIHSESFYINSRNKIDNYRSNININHIKYDIGLLRNIKYINRKLNIFNLFFNVQDNSNKFFDFDSFNTNMKSYISNILTNYFTIDHIYSYIAIILSGIFLYCFLVDFYIKKSLCIVITLIMLTVLSYYTCKDLICNIEKYLYLYMITPSIFFINLTINKLKYLYFPLAVFCLATIFVYNFEIPFMICSLFIFINIIYILRYIVNYKKSPLFKPYLKQMMTLAIINAFGYILSLYLGKQFYYKIYHFVASLF
jgi:hypothetical protein